MPSRPTRWRRAWSGRFRWWTRAGAVVLALALALTGDVVLLSARIGHIPLRLPAGGTGQTWVIVGSDSRDDIPAGADQASFGSPADVPGQRADIVLVVHVSDTGMATTLSIPRDLVVRGPTGRINRLALTYADGAQTMVDDLCVTLGIPTTHLTVVDFAAFAAIVDVLGGVSVTLPHPVRDQWSGLNISAAGAHTLGGEQALALVRSRHAEDWVNGRWVPEVDGAGQRTYWGGVVFDSIRQNARRARTSPILAQRLAWAVTGSMTTDSGTGVFDLAELAGMAGAPVDLPVAPVSGTDLAVQASPATFAVLAAAGMDRSCRPT